MNMKHVKFDQAELAVRMIEACYQTHRASTSAIDSLMLVDHDMRESWLRAADVAIRYLVECLNAGGVQHELIELQRHPDMPSGGVN
jgi:hypothetical protein